MRSENNFIYFAIKFKRFDYIFFAFYGQLINSLDLLLFKVGVTYTSLIKPPKYTYSKLYFIDFFIADITQGIVKKIRVKFLDQF